jgi:hypothetical protein
MGSSYHTFAQQLADAIEAGHDYAPHGLFPDGHLSAVVYSHTRRKRGLPNWAFDVKHATLVSKPHWLRSRAA